MFHSMPNLMGLLSDAKDYARSGMDYVSDLMPERDVMKSYIDGPYDDYVIDKVGDGYNYLRGLLDDAPSQRTGGIGVTSPYPNMQAPPPPSGPYPGMQGQRSSPRITDLFESKREPATRPKLMDVLAGANRRAPRPMVWGAAAGSVPEEFARLSDMPRGTPESMYRQMSSPRPNPMGLLSGEMTPKRFEVEEAVVQPIQSREFSNPNTAYDSAYMEADTRDRLQRSRDMAVRQQAADRRLRNARMR